VSKAFTKEDSETDQDGEGQDLELQSLPTRKNYMTPVGHARLKSELQNLLYTQRPDMVQVVAWAASNGDRSENGDYLYGKKRLREIDRRIRFLTKRLEIAEVVDPSSVQSKRVQFGATVTYAYESGVQKTIQIVGIDEIAPSEGKISWISPLAKALLNQPEGESVSFVSPRGEEELVIVKVEYVSQK
jgi:transcription elongation factor GreB